ncbi:7-deoxyloganetin glucosyltransferase-like [Coffea eugenioides]|uniref:Glycosyltransferase n=1 Tax=Coffea arabica TaxID=13443 RepID=A0A6P6UXD5_COFAR|nr:7-deoxyloganetin glucosyltransferase-like [Coffea arabica]XP_027148093.1 7-deoxyloganetin glucosyltransferase-like [Coffea eugenioides]
MGSTETATKPKPHAIFIPFPAQGHINPMFKLAKILHHKGFHITFVHSEFNQRRLLKSRGKNALDGLPSFQFETIPDGLPFSDADATQDVPSLCDSASKNCLAPFRQLVTRLNSSPGVPPVSCIVSDGIMSFTLEVARELGIPDVFFWTTGAGGVMAYLNYRNLVEKGYTPLKDCSYLTNGYLDTTVIDWIPGMKGIRLKDLPSFIRTTDRNDIMLNFAINQAEKIHDASALILNTFDAMEPDVLDAFSSILPAVYTLGPLHLIEDQLPDNELKSLGSNLWKEELGCIEWLDSKEPNSVVYVNFGSVTVMTPQQLVEFAWGLAKSGRTFLWIIRPDLVIGETAILPPEFVLDTKERGLLASWCPQVDVLKHPSIGGFLTHCGWNSTLESICAGVPMVCWPFFAEQQTNCWYCCNHLGTAMEIDNNVKSDEVEKLVNELMVGDRGQGMKKKAAELKKLAEEAITAPSGSSYKNLESLVHDVLMSSPAPN